MSTKGVLLVNLGSPTSTAVGDVRRYLREFLMDGRVLDAPWPIRFLIVHLAILPRRPHNSAEAYRQIWTPAGSPLIVTSRNVQHALQPRVTVPVELAMRYQQPSIPDAVARLAAQGVNELLLIPLFPHYAMSSYETAVERVREVVSQHLPAMRLQVQPPYFDHPDYLTALAASVQEYVAQDHDHLLFSFHGVPERHLRKSDPTGHHCLQAADCCAGTNAAHATCYRAQCLKTVAGVAQATGLDASRYSVAFQSRLGRDPWLRPYTDQELVRLAQSGVRRLLVVCPAFVADCLETLEEIGLRGRETFLEAGGKEFTRIPCLNEHPQWLAALERMIGAFVDSPAH